jgi:hypothetical protein
MKKHIQVYYFVTDPYIPLLSSAERLVKHYAYMRKSTTGGCAVSAMERLQEQELERTVKG